MLAHCTYLYSVLCGSTSCTSYGSTSTRMTRVLCSPYATLRSTGVLVVSQRFGITTVQVPTLVQVECQNSSDEVVKESPSADNMSRIIVFPRYAKWCSKSSEGFQSHSPCVFINLWSCRTSCPELAIHLPVSKLLGCETRFKVRKEFNLLVLLILHNLQVRIIGEHGRPSHERGITIGHLAEIHFTLGSRISHGRSG